MPRSTKLGCDSLGREGANELNWLEAARHACGTGVSRQPCSGDRKGGCCAANSDAAQTPLRS
eukprot:15101836-Alexandrium_andersonii.AAC.1